jgi:dipeptidyl aminopeptidase/acylaminoacyl peptidase
MPNTPRLLLAASTLLLGAAAPVHEFLSVAISPDGTRVASVEGDQSPAGEVAIRAVVIRSVADGTAHEVKLPCGAVEQCTPSSLAWDPDGAHISFILRSPGSHAHAIYTADATTGALQRRVAFEGTLAGLRYGPGGRIAVLATAGANKEVGAVEAGAAQTGVLGADVHEQRIAILGNDGTLTFASPPNLFVYEYAWRPNGQGFVGTAAPGDGDANWWVAKLYAFSEAGKAQPIYTPATPQLQLAQPEVSPDGTSVSFVAGLMSDFGATGGEAYVLKLSQPNATPVDVTPHWPATITSLAWACDNTLLASQLHADQTQIIPLAATPNTAQPKPLYSAQQFIGGQPFEGSNAAISTACHTKTTATILQSFTKAPEIVAGPMGQWHDLTQVNAALKSPAVSQSVSWTNDGFNVQGWLLMPAGATTTAKLPMITEVHGGPSWANQPQFPGRGYVPKLLNAGYAVFLPNPRGSFGQGEIFTKANVRDFGYGDLRDILTGVTAAGQAAPIDENRLGLTGWSYGGYMTMWAVTQTNRFKAAVAGAGIADWQSYYGENGIDEWMIPFFGASVYNDPAVYAKSSPIDFIKNVRTPTLEVVGENDIECPAPQTQEFWHALHDLGVPTQSVIYPGEGHAMRNPLHQEDFEQRAVAWFNTYLGKGKD